MISPEDYVNLEVGSYISDKIEIPENISPQTYFAFAVSDIEGADDERSRVNSLSNAKRALHFQVDLIAKAYGFANPRNRANFHEKLEFCRNCGIVGPRILRKLNKVRNAVEHEYYIPQKSEVEDFVDVVELFLAATDRCLARFPKDIELRFEERVKPDAPDIHSLDIDGGFVYLFVHPGHTEGLTAATLTEWKRQHSIKIGTNSGDYFKWVRFAIENAQ